MQKIHLMYTLLHLKKTEVLTQQLLLSRPLATVHKQCHKAPALAVISKLKGTFKIL